MPGYFPESSTQKSLPEGISAATSSAEGSHHSTDGFALHHVFPPPLAMSHLAPQQLVILERSEGPMHFMQRACCLTGKTANTAGRLAGAV
jgi:hypothetical protein